MENVVLVIHLFLALALIGVILLQPSAEGGGLTSSSSSVSGFMTPRGSANLLTRVTIILALGFMATSLTLVVLSGVHKKDSVLDQIDNNSAGAPATTSDITPSDKKGVEAPAVPTEKPLPPPKKSAAPSVPTDK
jgi:preprotein translocase subunit SecG